jgi:hypothetical protein
VLARARTCDQAGGRFYAHASMSLLSIIQHAGTVLSFVASLAPTNFSILSHKLHGFPKNVTENKMDALIFSTSFI